MNKKIWIIVLVVVIVLACCCVIIALTGAGGYLVKRILATSTPDSATFPISSNPAESEAYQTLHTLENSVVPVNDLRELATRFNGISDIPETIDKEPVAYQVGDQEKFWVSNQDTNKNFQVDVTLRYITGHTYFWVENGVDYNENTLKKLADTFEDKIYPTDREFFGSEWTPGIDNDPHLYIIYARQLGSSIAGYFSSVDSVNPLAHKYSNAHEDFMMNADNVDLGDSFTYGVLAHEFQHMIHWYNDRNEETWLNEGFSELAAFLNGYYEGGFDRLYIANPDLQLTDWPNDHNATTPHYGASFLFVNYFLDRFGEEATKKLVADTKNGMVSVDDVLLQMNETNPETGQSVTGDDVFADWVITNFLNNSNIEDGRFAYHRYQDAARTAATESINKCPFDWLSRQVNQYGVD